MGILYINAYVVIWVVSVLVRLKEKLCRIAPDKVTIGPISWNFRERVCGRAED